MENIDYRKILEKYISHVKSCEGTDFIENRSQNDFDSEIKFTDKEWSLLNSISQNPDPFIMVDDESITIKLNYHYTNIIKSGTSTDMLKGSSIVNGYDTNEMLRANCWSNFDWSKTINLIKRRLNGHKKVKYFKTM